MSTELITPEFIEDLRIACEQNPEFVIATAFADTRLVLAFGNQRYFWKIYKSRIIDSIPFVTSFDPLGYDVIVQAPLEVWRSIAGRRSKVWDHFNGFELEIGGNHLEAHRMHEAILIICQDLIPEIAGRRTQ